MCYRLYFACCCVIFADLYVETNILSKSNRDLFFVHIAFLTSEEKCLAAFFMGRKRLLHFFSYFPRKKAIHHSSELLHFLTQKRFYLLFSKLAHLVTDYTIYTLKSHIFMSSYIFLIRGRM